jgi:hypothetical protein
MRRENEEKRDALGSVKGGDTSPTRRRELLLVVRFRHLWV